MSLLNADIQSQIRSVFAELKEPVDLVLYTQGGEGTLECDYCSETRSLLEELAELSDKLTLHVRGPLNDTRARPRNRKRDATQIFPRSVRGDSNSPTRRQVRRYTIRLARRLARAVGAHPTHITRHSAGVYR